MNADGAYINCNGAVVVPNCPDAGGDHSHFLNEDGANFEKFDGETYVCPFVGSESYPASSGEPIHVQMESAEAIARIEALIADASRG